MIETGLLSTGLALSAAFLFALGSQFSRLGLQHTGSPTGALIQIAVSALLFWLFSALFIEAHYWLMPVVVLFAVIGIFRPFLSSRLAMAGNKHLGPTVSSTLAGTSPLFGVTLGILVLGEDLTPAVLIGTVCIFVGITFLSWRPGNITRDWPLWALLLPIGAAFLRASTNLFAKLGMESLASPYFVSLVGTTVAAAIALTTRREGISIDIVRNAGFKWFCMTGISFSFATLSLNTALSQGKLVAVAPILACAPLFSLLLGWTIFREQAINKRVVFAVGLIVPSVVAITLSH